MTMTHEGPQELYICSLKLSLAVLMMQDNDQDHDHNLKSIQPCI